MATTIVPYGSTVLPGGMVIFPGTNTAVKVGGTTTSSKTPTQTFNANSAVPTQSLNLGIDLSAINNAASSIAASIGGIGGAINNEAASIATVGSAAQNIAGTQAAISNTFTGFAQAFLNITDLAALTSKGVLEASDWLHRLDWLGVAVAIAGFILLLVALGMKED
jgi:hypothetical protein